MEDTMTTDTVHDLAQIPVMDDDVEHWICAQCHPGYTPGKIVVAVCGELSEDCPPGTVSDGTNECARCTEINFCPACGTNMDD